MRLFEMLLLVALVSFCCALRVRAGGDHVLLNPLQRALFELRDAYAQPDDGDLCGGSTAINAECAVCTALGSTAGDAHCCSDVDAFATCHLRVIELMGQLEMLEKNVIKAQEKEAEAAMTSLPALDKRYGSVFSNWNWFSSRPRGNNRRYNKRFGNLFGNTYATVQSNTGGTHKRYGNLFGHMFTSGGRPKRYGNMFGNVYSQGQKTSGSK